MSSLIVDSSVVVKWFHDEAGPEQEAARRIRDASWQLLLEARIIDLANYEVGNLLLRRLGWTGQQVAEQLADLEVICGPPLSPTPAWLALAAELADHYRLSFYDAAWGAAALASGMPLVSTDMALVHCGLAELPSEVVGRLDLG